jgi:hypothetical protein
MMRLIGHRVSNLYWLALPALCVCAALVFPAVSLAQSVGTTRPAGIENPLRFDTISALLKAIIDTAMVLATPIAVLFLVYAGFLFVTARGNETQLTTAKRVLGYTLLGIVVIFGAWLLTMILYKTIDEVKAGSSVRSGGPGGSSSGSGSDFDLFEP